MSIFEKAGVVKGGALSPALKSLTLAPWGLIKMRGSAFLESTHAI